MELLRKLSVKSLIMMFAVLMLSTFTACSSDDDDENVAEGIIGYWQPVNDEESSYVIRFDGNRYYGYYGRTVMENGTYTVNGDIITVTGTGADEGSWSWKATLSDNRLYLHDMEYDETTEYVRISESDLPDIPETPDVPMPDQINIADFVGTWTYSEDDSTLDITFDANGNISMHQYGMENGSPFSYNGIGTYSLVGTTITTRVLWDGNTEEEIETGTIIGLSQEHILIRYREGGEYFDQLFSRK